MVLKVCSRNPQGNPKTFSWCLWVQKHFKKKRRRRKKRGEEEEEVGEGEVRKEGEKGEEGKEGKEGGIIFPFHSHSLTPVQSIKRSLIEFEISHCNQSLRINHLSNFVILLKKNIHNFLKAY